MDVPEYYNFASDVVDRWALEPNKTALVYVNAEKGIDTRFSFAELAERSRRLAAALQEQGLKAGDRVGVFVGREPAWWIAMIGLIRAGIVALPGATMLTGKDIKLRANSAGMRGVVCDSSMAAKVDSVLGDCQAIDTRIVTDAPREGWLALDDLLATEREPEPVHTRASDPCLIYFTSGTTGFAKMVLHTHVSYPLAHEVTGRLWLDLKPDDLHWNLSDTGWAKAAWSSLFGPWIQGAAVFVQAAAGKFSPEATLRTLGDYPITSFCAPPTAYRQLVTLDLTKFPFHSLRSAVSAGEPLNPEVIASWKGGTGITIRDGYGQTESVLLVGNFPGKPIKPGSMGVPAPGATIEILDDELRPAPAGQEGEVAVRVKPERPLGLFVHYVDNPAENSLKFRGDYYLTGDRAYRDEEGYFWFVGRADDVITSAGYRIGPFEVESALLEHDAVVEAAVVGAPDPARFEIVKAYVVLGEGYSPSEDLVRELQQHVKTVTAPYKYPREIEFVTSLPKTISGKIRRIELRQREREKKNPS